MKRFWMKFLASSIVCTSLVSVSVPLMADTSAINGEQAITITEESETASDDVTDETVIEEQVDPISIEEKQDTQKVETEVKQITDSVKKDGNFNMFITGIETESGKANVTLEITDDKGVSLGVIKTDALELKDGFGSYANIELPKYKENDVFRVYLKEADDNVQFIRLNEYFLDINNPDNYAEVKIESGISEETGKPVLLGDKDYILQLDIIEKQDLSNKVGIMLYNGNIPVYGESLKVTDIQNSVSENISTLDSYVYFDKKDNTTQLDIKLSEGYYVFVDNGKDTITVDLKTLKNGTVDLRVTKGLGVSKQETALKEGIKLNVNIESDYNTDLSTYWANIVIKMQTGEGHKMLDDLKFGKNEVYLMNGKYTPTLVESKNSELTGLPNSVNLTKESSMTLKVKPKNTLQVSKSKDGVAQNYKFRVINVPEIADKVYSGSKAIEFAVMSGEAYMIEDVDTGEVLSVVINQNSTVTKVVLGEGVVTGFASVPETGDNGTPLMLGLILSLAGVFIIGGKIVYSKRKLKPTVEGTKKLFTLLLIGTLLTGLMPIDTYADSMMDGSWGHTTGSADKVPYTNAGLKGNMVRVYPVKLDQLGFGATDNDYNTNGTVDKLMRGERNWLYKYSLYFTPTTSVYNKWSNSAAFITLETDTLALSDHEGGSYVTKGNYHYYDSTDKVLYHDLFDSNHTKTYMKEGARKSSTINAETKTMSSYKSPDNGVSYKWVGSNYTGENTNLFVDTISSSIVGKDLSVQDYGTQLQDKFTAILKDDNLKFQLWDDYKKVALDTGMYSTDEFNDLQRAFEEGRLGFFVETLIGMEVDGCDDSHGKDKHDTHTMFMSTNTYLKILRMSKKSMFDYVESNKEYEVANKSGVGGCYGGASCTRTSGGACKFFHHVGWLNNNIEDSYTRTIKPATIPITKRGNNPFGGWGYLHLKGGVEVKSQPGVYVIIKDAKVVEDSGVMYLARGVNNSTTIELNGFEEYNSDSNNLELLIAKGEIKEGVPLFDDGTAKARVLNNLGKAVVGQLQFTDETEIRVFLDSDYVEGNVTDLNTEITSDYTYVPNYLGVQAGLGKDSAMTQKEVNANVTKTGSNLTSIKIGGGDEATNWYAKNLEDFIRSNNKTYLQDKKAKDGMLIKRKGSLSDVVIVVRKAEFKIVDTEADESDKVVPEWRLSKYWGKLVDASDEVYGTSNIGEPQRDESDAHTTGELTPSGFTSFNKSVKKDTLPEYLFTKPLWGNGETGNGSITRDSTTEEIKIQGDLLATKKNEEIDNIKVSNWISGSPDLTNIGINSTNTGKSPTRGSFLGKNYTFEYILENPNSYTNTYGIHSHSSDEDEYDVCDCYLGSETLSDTSTGKRENAKYPTNIAFERYMPRDTVAPKFDYKENGTNGKVTLSAQSPVSLLVNPEVLMEYADISGRDNVTFTAGDKMREVKPVSYHSIEYKVTVAPKANGSAVATDNQAKALASRLNAGGKQVIYKGAGTNVSFDINGIASEENGYVETKSYILDIGNTAIKNTWNPSTTYNSQKISEQFLSKFATKGADSKWTANSKVVGQLKIDAQLYGKNLSNLQLPQIDANVTEYRLTVRGGKLTAVNGDTNFKNTLNAETIKAFEEMTLLNDSGVLSVFDKGQGKKPEASFVSLGNAVRGTNALATSTGWYNEDTTVLVVREYTNKFEVPVSMFVDKIPMTVPNLTTPMNKMDFFTQGKTGHTVYTNAIVSSQATLNPYDNASGTKDACTMVHDSSATDSPFGNRTIDYIVPNVSILDTMQ